MAANKPPARPAPIAWHWLRLALRPQNRGLFFTAMVLIAAIAAAIYSWQRWGTLATQSADYVVTSENISVTPQPAWIHSDVKADVVRTAGLSRLALRDKQLVEHVARAFALHPWVAKVVRVEKQFPAKVEVEVIYRRPVAVVSVAARGEGGLLFIDEESVLLPTSDFASTQARDYLRIEASGEIPAGIYGTRWGSPRLAAAARLAAVWGDRWKSLGLYSIASVQSSTKDLEYELRTASGIRVVWGAAPGSESLGEPSAEQKIAALERLVHDKGPLDRTGGPAVIDLREAAGSQHQAQARDVNTQ